MEVELLESSLFAPFHSLLKESLDEFFIPFVDEKLCYLFGQNLVEDPSKDLIKITVEKLVIGLNDTEIHYLENYVLSDLYKTIDRFATFATTEGKNIDAIFEDERTLYKFIKYLNTTESGDISYMYSVTGTQIYIGFRIDSMSQHEIVTAYMNKNFRVIIMSYVENYVFQLSNPLK